MSDQHGNKAEVLHTACVVVMIVGWSIVGLVSFDVLPPEWTFQNWPTVLQVPFVLIVGVLVFAEMGNIYFVLRDSKSDNGRR